MKGNKESKVEIAPQIVKTIIFKTVEKIEGVYLTSKRTPSSAFSC